MSHSFKGCSNLVPRTFSLFFPGNEVEGGAGIDSIICLFSFNPIIYRSDNYLFNAFILRASSIFHFHLTNTVCIQSFVYFAIFSDDKPISGGIYTTVKFIR